MTHQDREIYRNYLKSLTNEQLSQEWHKQECLIRKTIVEIEAVKRRFRIKKEPP